MANPQTKLIVTGSGGTRMDFSTINRIRYYYGTADETVKMMKENLDAQVVSCRRELVWLFNRFLSNAPSNYWDRNAYEQTILQLENTVAQHTEIVIDDLMMEHFLIAYHTHLQVTEIINDLSGLNDSAAIKDRQYRIPTYISIVEGCLTNLFRFIALLLNQTTAKDYSSQYKLNPLCTLMEKSGLNLLTADINIDIRNAINHGGIILQEDGQRITFIYNKDHKSSSCTMRAYDMDRLINRVYDISSAAILAIAMFLNNNWEKVAVDCKNKTFVSFSLLSMELSIPGVQCRYITEVPNNTQLNLDFYIEKTNRDFIFQTALILLMLVYPRFSDYRQYFIAFSGERLQTSWIRLTNQEIHDAINQVQALDQVLLAAMKRKDVVIFEPSTQNIDLQEIKYFRFPNYKTDNFFVNQVADASVEDRKRIKYHLFIGAETNKERIIEFILESIQWAKGLKNVDSPTLHRKCGDMDADAIYINVYRYDGRKEKELFPQNENFVCFVDYNVDGITTLEHGGLPAGIWNQLHHEKTGLLDISWREGRYVQRVSRKIGANERCPCGSGKKFKKCCRGKGIYD